MTKTTTCIYHFLVWNWYIFLNYYIPLIGKDEEKLKEFHDGGRSKYLTLLNLTPLISNWLGAITSVFLLNGKVCLITSQILEHCTIFLLKLPPEVPKEATEAARESVAGGELEAKMRRLLQAVFFGVACLDDVLKRIIGRKDITIITSIRDLLFTTLVFPISAFIFLVFWTLFHYDRSLIYPKGLDDFFPAWLNHAMEFSMASVLRSLTENRTCSQMFGSLEAEESAVSQMSRAEQSVRVSTA
ncbi:androgen dependent TFPI regulating protein [Cricetulus griseus]